MSLPQEISLSLSVQGLYMGADSIGRSHCTISHGYQNSGPNNETRCISSVSKLIQNNLTSQEDMVHCFGCIAKPLITNAKNSPRATFPGAGPGSIMIPLQTVKSKWPYLLCSFTLSSQVSLKPYFSSSAKWENKCNSFIGLLWELNEIIFIKFSALIFGT